MRASLAPVLALALVGLPAAAQEAQPAEVPPEGADGTGEELDGELAEDVEPEIPVVPVEGLINANLAKGTWLYTAPDVEAARARWGKAPGGDDLFATLDSAMTVGVYAEKGDFLRIGAPRTADTGLCAGRFDQYPLELQYWVKADSLMISTTREHTLDGGEDTRLTLAAGVPVQAWEEGGHLASDGVVQARLTLPADAVGVRFERSAQLGIPEANAGLPTAATILGLDQTFEIRLPKSEAGTWPIEKLDASAEGTELVYGNWCMTIRGRTQDAVGMKPQPAGGLGTSGVFGALGGDELTEIQAETALSFGDGDEAGRTMTAWFVDPDDIRVQDDGRSCTSFSPSRDEQLGPEGLVTLCWPSDADLTPEERLALRGPPPEPVVLPDRKPPKKAKLKGVDIPMDVEAHIAIDLMPLDPNADMAEATESLTEVTKGKALGLVQLEKYFSQQMIENPEDTDLVVMFAVLYEDMGASLLDAWIPTNLTEEQSDIYRKALADKALPQCNKAYELYNLAGERARSASVPPRSLKTIAKALDRLQPDDRADEDSQLEACFRSYNW